MGKPGDGTKGVGDLLCNLSEHFVIALHHGHTHLFRFIGCVKARGRALQCGQDEGEKKSGCTKNGGVGHEG